MNTATPEPKILDKIRKLLRLASSSNQHEAAAAAARAAELMLEHQISEAKLDVLGGDAPQEAISETDIASVGSKIVHWKGLVVRGLCDAFGTSYFWVWHRDWKTQKRVVNVRIVGRQTETQTVSYMFAYLVKEVDRLADETYNPDQDENRIFMAPGAATRKWKESFRLGASEEICLRLQEQRKKTFAAAQAAGASQALARIDKSRDEIEVWKRQRHPDLKAVRGPQASPDADGYRAGRSAGRNVNLGSGNKGLGAPPKRIGGG